MSQPELIGPPLKPGKYIKVTIFLKKKDGITDEYFHSYWLHNHTHRFLKTKAFKTLCRKYSQVPSSLLSVWMQQQLTFLMPVPFPQRGERDQC